MNEEDDTVEVGNFSAGYPVWVLFRESFRSRMPESRGVVPFHSNPNAMPVLLVFTTEDLAKAFIASVGVADLQTLAVATASDFASICRFHHLKGVKNIAVDLSLATGMARKYAISEIIQG